MGKQTHDLGINCLAHNSTMLYHYTKSLSLKSKFHHYLIAKDVVYYFIYSAFSKEIVKKIILSFLNIIINEKRITFWCFKSLSSTLTNASAFINCASLSMLITLEFPPICNSYYFKIVFMVLICSVLAVMMMQGVAKYLNKSIILWAKFNCS